MSKEDRKSDPGIGIHVLLEQLGSKELSSRLKAIESLSQLNASSAEIIHALKGLVLNDPSKKVQEAAIGALFSSTHRALQRQITHLTPNSLKTILHEIDRWQVDNDVPSFPVQVPGTIGLLRGTIIHIQIYF